MCTTNKTLDYSLGTIVIKLVMFENIKLYFYTAQSIILEWCVYEHKNVVLYIIGLQAVYIVFGVFYGVKML